MLTSLFGELGLPKTSDEGRIPGTIESDGGFAATSVLETTGAELNDRGQMIDRRVRDLFVTGSPAQAMREHFATSRAELENAGKWIVLVDPSRIWGSAVVKALSDASGQPIDRLHLREQGTLRTLAMIERTSIVRRLDESIKVYHADVRASGHENAEVSLVLMERAHLTAVIVGQMQPQAIDAMLEALCVATCQPTWRCPTLLFLLPPSAVWIANKIAGIAWPAGLRVQVLNESLSSASSVWNAVLGIWNHVKDDRLWSPAPALPEVTEFQIRLSELAPSLGGSAQTMHQRDVAPANGDAPPAEATFSASLDPSLAANVMSTLMRSDGLLGCAIVDSATGLVLAREQRESSDIDLEIAAAACAQVVRAQRLAGRHMAMPDHLDEMIISAGSRQQIVRVLGRHPELFMFALFERSRTNLALARFRILEAEKGLL